MKRGGEDGGKADEGREGRRERRDIGTTTHPSPPHTSDDNNSLVPNAHRLWTAFPMHFWCLFFGIRGKGWMMWLFGLKTLNDCGIMNDEEAEFYEWSH
jgi:hypothetical protein